MNRTSPSSRLVSKRRKVAGLGDDRSGRGAEADAHLARKDAGKRRLSEAGRAVEQDVVERLAAAFRGIDEDAQVLARRLLADELVEALRPKRRIGVFARALGRRDSGGIGGHRCEFDSQMDAPATRRLLLTAS